MRYIVLSAMSCMGGICLSLHNGRAVYAVGNASLDPSLKRKDLESRRHRRIKVDVAYTHFVEQREVPSHGTVTLRCAKTEISGDMCHS